MKQIAIITAVICSTFIVFGFQKFSVLPSENKAFTATDENSPPPAFDVPDGFSVEQILGPDEIKSLVALTFDSQGRIVVAKEFGEVVTLVPNGNEGYDQVPFTDKITGSQGIFFDGSDLLVTGLGPEGVGLYRVYDDDGDSRGDRVQLLELVNRRIEDHGAHNAVFGPDGYLYWAMGNVTDVYSSDAPLSPVRDYDDFTLLDRGSGDWFSYRTPGGIFIRNSPEAIGSNNAPVNLSAPTGVGDWQLFAMGLRNEYDGAFNMMGELFTYDSDMEPDLSMPWYRPVKTQHVVPGGDYGWREGSGDHPTYFFDDLSPTEEVGRGSPTGVTFYQAYNYPEKYWDIFLQSDWSRGRILMGDLTKNGSTYTQNSEEFVHASPLNVTDLEVGPDGNVYFSLGGRNTEGGVYRVVYNGPDAMTKPEANTPLEEVLTMIEPRSAFSRKKAREIKDQMGDDAWGQELTAVVKNGQASPERRVRAMELLQVYGPGLDINTLRTLTDNSSWKIRASAAYYLGMHSNNEAREILAGLLHDDDPFVQRRAASALLRTGLIPSMDSPVSAVDDVFPLLASSDEYLRYAGRTLLREIDPNEWKENAMALSDIPQATQAIMAYFEAFNSPDQYDLSRFLSRTLELMKMNPSNQELLDLVRLANVGGLMDHGIMDFPVRETINPSVDNVMGAPGSGGFGPGGPGGGQAPATLYEQIGQLLLDKFPTDDWRLNREISRTLADLETLGAAEKISAELDNSQIDLKQQMFYVDMLGFLENGWDQESVDRVTDWYVNVYENNLAGGQYLSRWLNGFYESIPNEFLASAKSRITDAQPQMAQTGGFNRGPAGDMTDTELQERVENLIYRPESFRGDAEMGAWAFQKGLCSSCHTFGPIGNNPLGPDLTTVGQRFGREDLVHSVAYPSETISSQYQATTITRNNGETVSGTVVREDPQEVVMQIPLGPQVTIPKSDIKSRNNANSQVSMMPEGLLGLLSNQEQVALFLMLEAGPDAIPDSALTRINGR